MKEACLDLIRSSIHDTPDSTALDEFEQRLLAWQHQHVSNMERFIGPLTSSALRRRHPVPAPLFARFEFCAGTPHTRFRTSGTTSGTRGVHCLPDLEAYELSIRAGIARLPFSIPVQNTLSLCPHASEFSDSSLAHMIQTLAPEASIGFCKAEGVAIEASWAWLRASEAPLFLPATALALASLLDSGESAVLPEGSIVMITGGYKGQHRSIPEQSLHETTRAQLGPKVRIIREYGMTELSSQLWDWGEGYRAPPWLRVFTQHTNADGIGQLCFVDLANWGSCMALETHDLGRVTDDRAELFGRISGMKARGCSLVVEEQLA